MSRLSAIDSSGASAPLAAMQGRKVFRLKTGTHAGRVVVLYRPSAAGIAFSWSDAPYQTWSAPVTIAADTSDSGFAACMHPDGSIYAAYTQDPSLALVCYKLVFDGEDWTPLTQQTIYNADANYDPSLAYEEGADRIWVVWTRFESGSGLYYIQNKRSLDDGNTWGLGPTDVGTALSDGSTGCIAQIFRCRDYMHCVYQDGGTAYRHRRYYLNSASWATPEDILTGSGFSDAFHAAASSDGRVGMIMADGAALRYREYDGDNWGAVMTVTDTSPTDPSVVFTDTTPIALWGEDRGSGYVEWLQSPKSATGFATPSVLNPVRSQCDHVLLYSAAASAPYADLTSEAADPVAADLIHPESGNLLASVDDALYCALSEPFDLLNLLLSTPGSGGAVQWEYWNASIWQAFIPASGTYDFSASPMRIRLFTDTWDVPGDWRPSTVNSITAFWIRARVTSAFTTPPVGSQLLTTDLVSGLQPLAEFA